MIGTGTLVNTAAITAGGLAGLLGGSLMSENMRDGLIKVNGAAVIMIGISGVISGMADISSGSLVMNGTLMMVACLSLGTAVGELINIEDRLTAFGEWLKEKSGSGSDAGFVNAFVTASLTVCIGAMAVVGAVQDGISGDWSTLAVKSILDFLIIMVMTAGMGKGCIFSAVPVFLFQGIRIAHIPEVLVWLAALWVLRRERREFAIMVGISVPVAIVCQLLLPYWG